MVRLPEVIVFLLTKKNNRLKKQHIIIYYMVICIITVFYCNHPKYVAQTVKHITEENIMVFHPEFDT